MVNPIIPLECPEKEDLEPSEYIDHTYHDTAGDSTLRKYVTEIPRFDFVTFETRIVFVD